MPVYVVLSNFTDLGRTDVKSTSDRLDRLAPVADLPPLHQQPPTDASPAPRRGWQTTLLAPPFGAAVILIGLLALLWLFALPTFHFGVVPFWPVVILGFFFIGRPRGGGRRY